MGIQFLSRDLNLPKSAGEIESRFTHDMWLMTDAERSALSVLLGSLRPECAIEIGTYKAGSLGILSKYSNRVYSIDMDPSFKTEYCNRFPNVKFIVGNSQDVLPGLLKNIQRNGEPLGFILVDGNHSGEGIRIDLENVLGFNPSQPLHIIMHDSFNPECRKGILTANWPSNPYVHMLELDYVVGRFASKEESDNYRTMWCGFALAIMLPEKRVGDILIHQNEFLMFQTAYWRSVYPLQKIKNCFSISKLKVRIAKFLPILARKGFM
jgi:hypothetical protein